MSNMMGFFCYILFSLMLTVSSKEIERFGQVRLGISPIEGTGLFLPLEVPVEGVLMGFSAYLLNENKFGLQVWREIAKKNSTKPDPNNPNLDYQLIFNSKAIKGINVGKESIPLTSECPFLKKGDRIGINLFQEPAPIPVTFVSEQIKFMPFSEIKDTINKTLGDLNTFDYIPFGTFSVEAYINTNLTAYNLTQWNNTAPVQVECLKTPLPDENYFRTTTTTKAPPTGRPGATGPRGFPGPRGPTGNATKGDTGAVGPTGPQGPVGANGSVGATGPMGSIGERGQPGATGSVGQRGPVGATGPVGPPGRPGWEIPSNQTGPVAGSVSSESEMNDTLLIISIILMILVLIALLLFSLGLWMWLRRRRKLVEELRRQDMIIANGEKDMKSLRNNNISNVDMAIVNPAYAAMEKGETDLGGGYDNEPSPSVVTPGWKSELKEDAITMISHDTIESTESLEQRPTHFTFDKSPPAPDTPEAKLKRAQTEDEEKTSNLDRVKSLSKEDIVSY